MFEKSLLVNFGTLIFIALVFGNFGAFISLMLFVLNVSPSDRLRSKAGRIPDVFIKKVFLSFIGILLRFVFLIA